jgi:proteasome lid subunit RPN8/RPN11
MNEAGNDTALTWWSAPECPFRIAYSPTVFEEIRLTVVDAFCSFPRGGAEIGGILVGQWQPGRLLITAYAPLECEHALGPSFTLSANDEFHLRELIAQAPVEFPGLVPVGWYHSHTRSEIFLSEADLRIHDRFFREPWQVALVLKPHMMQPTRAGFFFREASGVIHSEAAYHEFLIEAQPMRHMPGAPALEPPDDRPRLVRKERNVPISLPAEPAPPLLAPEPEPEPVAPVREMPPPPSFLLTEPEPSRGWVAPLLIVCAAAALGAGGYLTHQTWLPKMMAAVRPSHVIPGVAPALNLTAIERDGQLQINWDRTAPAIRNSVDATLEIADGSLLPQSITLDQAHLHNGFFTYARQNERVDMKLILHQPDGSQVREVTTFLGKLPEQKTAEDPEIRKQRDELAAHASKLQTDLDRQAARTRKLEKDLKTIRDEMRQQQQRRMTNQIPEGK